MKRFCFAAVFKFLVMIRLHRTHCFPDHTKYGVKVVALEMLEA